MLAEMEQLQPVELRVLGSLLEKDMATPEYYPMTLNAVVNACNQKSSREPIVQYDEDTVLQAIASLRAKGLISTLSGAGHRVEKYGHRISDKLNLGRRELALLCVLMLRGPQTEGELRSRTERLHRFVDLEEVEACLRTLADLDPEPLVTSLPRGRWAHLLGGVPQSTPENVEAAAPRHPLEDRVTALENELELLKQQFADFRKQFE